MYNLFLSDINLFVIGITLLMMIDIILTCIFFSYVIHIINCCKYCLALIVMTFARS